MVAALEAALPRRRQGAGTGHGEERGVFLYPWDCSTENEFAWEFGLRFSLEAVSLTLVVALVY